MTFRPHRAFVPSVRVSRVALAVLGAACVIFGANPGDARAQASDAAAASVTAAASSAGGAQYAVKPGQSLGDIASELTGSKDRATREKMARALFDANPGAFMGHDPSRLKLGSVLTVPAVDLGGASGAGAASAAAATAGSATVPASAPALAPAPATNEAVVPGETASAASGAQSTEAVTGASEPHVVGGAIQASTAPATSAASEASTEFGASAGLPGSAATSTATPAAASTSNSTMIVAGVGVLIVALVLFLRSRRRRASASDTVAREASPPSALATGAANLDSASVQRGEGELNAVAASMEDYDAAQTFDTPTDDERLPVDDARYAASPTGQAGNVVRVTDAPMRESVQQPAPFVPEAPSARHRDFVPPLRTVGAMEAEADAREAEKREADVRESAAREAAGREEARTADAREEARAQDAHAAEVRDAETPKAAEREADGLTRHRYTKQRAQEAKPDPKQRHAKQRRRKQPDPKQRHAKQRHAKQRHKKQRPRSSGTRSSGTRSSGAGSRSAESSVRSRGSFRTRIRRARLRPRSGSPKSRRGPNIRVPVANASAPPTRRFPRIRNRRRTDARFPPAEAQVPARGDRGARFLGPRSAAAPGDAGCIDRAEPGHASAASRTRNPVARARHRRPATNHPGTGQTAARRGTRRPSAPVGIGRRARRTAFRRDGNRSGHIRTGFGGGPGRAEFRPDEPRIQPRPAVEPHRPAARLHGRADRDDRAQQARTRGRIHRSGRFVRRSHAVAGSARLERSGDVPPSGRAPVDARAAFLTCASR